MTTPLQISINVDPSSDEYLRDNFHGNFHGMIMKCEQFTGWDYNNTPWFGNDRYLVYHKSPLVDSIISYGFTLSVKEEVPPRTYYRSLWLTKDTVRSILSAQKQADESMWIPYKSGDNIEDGDYLVTIKTLWPTTYVREATFAFGAWHCEESDSVVAYTTFPSPYKSAEEATK